MKCSFCGKDFEPNELFCLTSCRGASSMCKEGECIVACSECLRAIRKCVVHLDLGENSDELFDQILAILKQIKM